MVDPAKTADHGAPDSVRAAPQRTVVVLVNALALAGLLYVFLVAIAMFGAAFKMLGSDFSARLITTTANPVIGLMIGLLSTSIIQSSSSTTSIVVGMVAGGALTVRGAIPIMMGANLGTTITNTLVAMASMNRRSEFQRAFAGATMHDFFNLLTILVLFPLEMSTRYLERTATWLSEHLVGSSGGEFPNPVKDVTMPAVHAIEDLLTGPLHLSTSPAAVTLFVVGLVALFVSLAFLTKLLKKLFLSGSENALTERMRGNELMAMFVHLLFNITGIAIFYPLPMLRRIPIWLATTLARKTAQRRVYAIVYIVGVFFVMPLAFLLLDKVMRGR